MDTVVFSHLRWNFVYQRPQHLLSRCAASHRVLFVEEPIFLDGISPRLQIRATKSSVTVAVPELPHGLNPAAVTIEQERLLTDYLRTNHISEPVLWYYTPMALEFTSTITASAIVYDCMDELSAFRGAPPGIRDAEHRLLRRADLVFTGGRSLFEAKRRSHPSVHFFPSSIDFQHFADGRRGISEPPDQVGIAHPRLGYSGVIDERMDIPLLDAITQLRPDWQFIMIGPIAKISKADLPQRDNLHFLGPQQYGDLPAFFSGWDVALLPFARNEATRFISPTKTPEYLAAGLPTVSTSIKDVVHSYGNFGLVSIADEPKEFIAACERLMRQSPQERKKWQQRADAFISTGSWDHTWKEMQHLIDAAVSDRQPAVVGPS